MRRSVNLSTLLVLAGCAASLPQIPPPGSPAQASAPRVQVGAEWTYAFHDGYTRISRGTVAYRVSAADGDTVTVQVRRGERETTELYTRDWSWRERPMTNLQNFRYQPAYAALPFPLEAGKSWRAYVRATDPATGRVNRVRIDGTVLGWDKVKVPAGEFDALKVRRLVYAGNHDHFTGEEQISEFDWYAPKLGLVIKHVSSSGHIDRRIGCDGDPCSQWVANDWNVLELVSYRHGPAAPGTR